jgi:hypothetical protein
MKNVKIPLLTAFRTTAMVDAMFEAIKRVDIEKNGIKV